MQELCLPREAAAVVTNALFRGPPRRPGRLVDRAQPALLPRPARPARLARGQRGAGRARGETIWYLWGTGSSIGLREAQTKSDAPYDRYRVGLHHLALEAGSRQAVNERADWLREQGAEIESGPEEYWYQPGYYAASFRSRRR